MQTKPQPVFIFFPAVEQKQIAAISHGFRINWRLKSVEIELAVWLTDDYYLCWKRDTSRIHNFAQIREI